MQRKDMPGHTVYLYEANYRRMPVLVLEPRTEVTAKERYSTFDARGKQLEVAYVRGDAPKTPGMLAIQWTNADSADEAARRLEELKNLDQSLITDNLGNRVLPDGAVAIVVWPKNIVSTWAEHIRPKPPRYTPEEEAESHAASERRAAREEQIRKTVEAGLAALGAAEADVEVYVDDWAEDASPTVDLTATISGADLLRLIDVELPEGFELA